MGGFLLGIAFYVFIPAGLYLFPGSSLVWVSVTCLLFLAGIWSRHTVTSSIALAIAGFIFLAFSLMGVDYSPYEGSDFQKFTVERVNLGKDLAIVRAESAPQQEVILVRNKYCNRGDRVQRIVKGSIKCAAKNGKSTRLADDFFMVDRYDSAAWFYTIFTGDKSYLSFDLKNFMRDFGISHMAAVSGFHLSIIIFIITIVKKTFDYLKIIGKVLSKKTLRTDIKNSDYSLGYVLLSFLVVMFWLYSIGYKISAVRAALCLFCSYLPKRLGVTTMFGFLVMLTPLDLYSPASRLSWVAYAFIQYFYSKKKLEPKEFVWFRVPGFKLKIAHIASNIRGWCIFNFRLQCMFICMSLVMVGETSLLSLAGNLLFLPILTIFLQVVLFVRLIFPESIYLNFCGFVDSFIYAMQEVFGPMFMNFQVIIASYNIPAELKFCYNFIFCLFLLKSLNLLPIVSLSPRERVDSAIQDHRGLHGYMAKQKSYDSRRF